MLSGPTSGGGTAGGAGALTSVDAQTRLARDPTLIGATQPRNDFFGWFGPFAFTGGDILTLVYVAAAALLVGFATITTIRRRARRARA